MTHFDVIVVGAGPAGNAAAYELAKAGVKTALLEKQTLPRHKTCGGGMPMVVSDTLRLKGLDDIPLEGFVEADTQYMRHTWKFDEPYLAPMNPDPENEEHLSLWMVQRSVFDNALANRAAKAGAELRDGLAVRSLSIEQDNKVHIVAEGNQGTWHATADTLIGADGANGIVAKSVGLRKNRALAIAIEAEVPHTWGTGHPDLRPDVCHLEYGAVQRGYAWVFPKGDHLNVGAGVFRPRTDGGRGDNTVREELRAAIMDYLRMLEVPKNEADLTFYAHPLPIWNGIDKIQTPDGKVLLAGDAAGLINPFFGDGILHALESGQIAAKSILAGNQVGYEREIEAHFRSNFDAALNLAKFFYQWSRFCYQHGVKRPTATRSATKLLCGQVRFNQIAARVMRRVRSAMFSSESTGETR